MTNRIDKLSQLKKLSAIKADSSWVKTTRHELLSEIDSQNRMMKAQRLSNSERIDMFLSRTLSRVVPTASRAMAGFLIIAMGSGFSMAAQASVPGQALWPVKRSIEKVELSLTTNPVKETEIYMKHINKRLDEIDKILSDQNMEPEKIAAKEKAVTQAISHLEKDVKSADSSLKIVKAEKTPIETVTLAKELKEAIEETTHNLEEQAETSEGALTEKVMAELIEINEIVEDSLIDLVLEVHEELIVDAIVEEPSEELSEELSEEPSEELTPIVLDPNKVDLEEVQAVADIVKEMIAGEIEDLETDIQEVKEKVGVVQEEQVEETVEELAAKSEEEIVEDAEIESDLVSEEATEKLDEAKVLLEGGSLQDAADKIIESKEIQEKTVEAIEKIEAGNEEVTEEVSQEDGSNESNDEVGETTSSSTDIVVEPADDPVEEYEVEASSIKEEEIILEEQEDLI